MKDKTKKTILITGACGFIGHHVVEHIIKNTNWNIVIIDKLTYASFGFERLRYINCFDNARVRIFTFDLAYPLSEGLIKEIGEIDYFVHMAAESHVDNSIANPIDTVLNNVNSTLYTLEYARKLKSLKKYVYFSTDEVFSTSLDGVAYKEGDRHNPTNPYSASKSMSESLCAAYSNTYKVPIVITNLMNNIGECQHKEKFLPKLIKSILEGTEVQIHSYPDCKRSGTRYYIHARNTADALLFILTKTNEFLDHIDASKGRFNIVGEKEVSNLELAQLTAKIIGKPLKYKMVNFHQDRPGHDLAYRLDGSKLKKLGWKPPKTFEESLTKTVRWCIRKENLKWLDLE